MMDERSKTTRLQATGFTPFFISEKILQAKRRISRFQTYVVCKKQFSTRRTQKGKKMKKINNNKMNGKEATRNQSSKTEEEKREIGISLYTINKGAKTIDEARNSLISVLFSKNMYEGLPESVSKEESTYGTKSLFDYCRIGKWSDFVITDSYHLYYGTGTKTLKDMEHFYDAGAVDFYSDGEGNYVECNIPYDEFVDFCEANNEFFVIEVIDSVIRGYEAEYPFLTADVLERFGLTEFKKEIEKNVEIVDFYYEMYNRAHEWLHGESKEKRAELYELKRHVIQDLMGLEPVAYHTKKVYHTAKKSNRRKRHRYYYDDCYDDCYDDNYDDYYNDCFKGCYDDAGWWQTEYYALYSFGGFTFHLPIDEDDVPENIELKTLEGVISAENKLPQEEKITVEEAIANLKKLDSHGM